MVDSLRHVYAILYLLVSLQINRNRVVGFISKQIFCYYMWRLEFHGQFSAQDTLCIWCIRYTVAWWIEEKTLILKMITKQNYVQLEKLLGQNYSENCKQFILTKIFVEYAKYSLIYSHFLKNRSSFESSKDLSCFFCFLVIY